jgi:ABC-type lipoprotein release transport system permease subunit
MGLVLGTAGALAAGRALQNQLFQTPATDVPTLNVVATLLLVVAAVASLIPTRRAVQIDPQTALRSE